MADHVLDATGLACPLPLMRAAKALKTMAAAETLEIIATDPASEIDFRAFCRSTGHELLSHNEQGGRHHFVIRKIR